MNHRNELIDMLCQYFGVGDSYHYVLRRVKEAFAVGTMGFDDFEEYNEETVEDIVEYLISNGMMVRRWIPVSESLPKFYPKKCQAVLVTMQDGEGKRFTTTAKYNEKEKYWYDFNDCRFQEFEVIAWMLKPAAYDS